MTRPKKGLEMKNNPRLDYYREQYRLNKEKYKVNWDVKKVEVFNRLGGRCANCGCDNFDALELHHVNGGGFKETRGKGIVLVNEIYRGRRGVENLRLLCGVCHKLEDLKLLKGLVGWEIKWLNGQS